MVSVSRSAVFPAGLFHEGVVKSETFKYQYHHPVGKKPNEVFPMTHSPTMPEDQYHWFMEKILDPKYLHPYQSAAGTYGLPQLVDCSRQASPYPQPPASYSTLPTLTSPDSDLALDRLLAQRGELIGSRIELILADMGQRREIKDQNLYRINLDQCAVRSVVLFRGEHVWDKYRFKLEEKLLGLEEEKRQEESGYFKDILMLKKELRDYLIQHQEEAHKTGLFTERPMEARP